MLREVFGFRHAEIAESLGRSEAAVRQLAHRAREHVQARRPRFDVASSQQREVTDRFLAAAMGGDLDGLMAVLAPDVVLVSDGGGKAQAARNPVLGAVKVARFLQGISGRPYQGVHAADIAVESAAINASAGLLFSAHGRVIAAVTIAVDGDRITAIQLVANPDKLRAVSAGRSLPM